VRPTTDKTLEDDTMPQQANLQVTTRELTGKGAARTLRRQGKVPGVIYGHDRTAESVVVDTAALTKMLVGISAATTIVDVTVDGRAPVKALIREIQRDSLRPAEIIHLDLYEVRGDEEITLQVPIRLIGVPDGVRNFGGVLDHVLRELEIEVLPSDIPEHVDLDVTALTIGHSLFVRDLQVPKAKVLNDPDSPICTVVAPRAEEAAAAAAAPEEAATAEPELIRKPKAEAEGETEEKA
jgi:large subunit ribosomal protein L25